MRRVAPAGAALLLAACQQAPARQAPATSAVSPAEQMQAEGDAFMAKGNYVDAVEKYRQAADLEPGSVIGPRFALGTAYSFLEKRPEAIAQFRWVLSTAPTPTRPSTQEARRWLLRVGARWRRRPRPGGRRGQQDARPERSIRPRRARSRR